MARIRTIKPEFPQSETIGALSRDARLLFIQLWTIADDEGRARAASRMLASLLYPYDTDAGKLMDRWLEELEEHKCIRRYEADGSKYLEITNWLKHQKIDKPSKSRLPAFVEVSRTVANPREASATDLGPRTLDQGPSTEDPPIRSVAVATRPRMPANDDFEKFKKAYPKREGSQPWQPARRAFEEAINAGETVERIVSAASKYASECDRLKITNTAKVAQARTWLNETRWNDYLNGTEADNGRRAEQVAFMATKGYVEDDGGGWKFIGVPGADVSHETEGISPVAIPALKRA
jgi:hypothetical protein